ncbi:MAG: efflux RND transporter periplasmic adaptor subunit [Acidobacteriota bacterium]|nr:efflux RND transporter periplasmic adaptor subunit [Acidobacteriota bacterium]
MRGSPLAPLMLVLATVLLTLAGCGETASVPTAPVERVDFVHRVTAEGVLQASRVTIITVPPQVQRRARLAWMAPEGVQVEAGEVVARFDPEEMEQQLQEAEEGLQRNRLEHDKSRNESLGKLAELKTRLEVAKMELETARRFRRTDTELYSRLEIVEDAVDEELAEERRKHAEEMSQIRGTLSQTELDLLSIEGRKAQLELEQAEKGLAALEVRAPHAGLLTWVRDFSGERLQVGASIWRGQPLAEIPDLTELEVEVHVLEADAAGLTPGKPAQVLVEAHPERSYAATIQRVDSIARPRSTGSPVQYFAVTLQLEEADLEIMKPGQRVRATLELERADDALVIPRQAVYEDEDGAFVYRVEGSRVEVQRVDAGPASLGLRVIAEGLEEGQRVALEKPPNLQNRDLQNQDLQNEHQGAEGSDGESLEPPETASSEVAGG